MADNLKARLKSHARSFDGLLSLIPAKLYYGEDVSDQWKRKKQTPEQKRAARMAKLDPDNWKSAKDVIDEREAAAHKRKREESGESSGMASDDNEITKAKENSEDPKTKKRKVDSDGKTKTQQAQAPLTETEEERKQQKAAQKAAKRERKQARLAKAKEKDKKQKVKKKEQKLQKKSKTTKPQTTNGESNSEDEEDQDQDDTIMPDAAEVEEAVDLPSLQVASQEDDASTATSSDNEASPILSPQLNSGTSSISSILPDAPESTTTENAPLETPLVPHDTPEAAKERLQAKISQLRAERKADAQPRNRQELLEQRRRKEEQRRAAKKEQWRKEREEEARRQDEEIADRFAPGGSGSLLASPRSPMLDPGNNFTFGRVAFGDGAEADAALSTLHEQRKKKGRSDPATALKAAQNKAERLSALDDEKRSTIEQQEMWLNAKRKAHGERVKDDTSLLKKALKRKEGEKKRSEKEWSTREEGVRFGVEKRQQKRESNLQKRRDEKGGGGKKANKSKVKRPGFEGSFRGRTGGGKKKA